MSKKGRDPVDALVYFTYQLAQPSQVLARTKKTPPAVAWMTPFLAGQLTQESREMILHSFSD